MFGFAGWGICFVLWAVDLCGVFALGWFAVRFACGCVGYGYFVLVGFVMSCDLICGLQLVEFVVCYVWVFGFGVFVWCLLCGLFLFCNLILV